MMQDPIARFAELLRRASQGAAPASPQRELTSLEPTACVLSTASADGQPSARVVLLKGFAEDGFVFYTNRQSRKGRQMAENPKASLCFFWPQLGEQVRVEGPVTLVSDDECDAYFATRPRDAQIGAWASQQSEPIPGSESLQDRVRSMTERFGSGPVPRPPHWGGYRLVPQWVEFWTEKPFRLHDRDIFEKDARGAWRSFKVFP